MKNCSHISLFKISVVVPILKIKNKIEFTVLFFHWCTKMNTDCSKADNQLIKIFNLLMLHIFDLIGFIRDGMNIEIITPGILFFNVKACSEAFLK
jgi:hypothetical protein